MEPTISGVGVLDKSVAVLRSLEAGPLSLSELAEATGFARATAHRLAVALETHGLVRRGDDGRFVLGVLLIALGRLAAEAIPLASAARPALEELRALTSESVQLYVRDGDRRVCIASLESPHGLRTIVAMGAVLPLSVGSAGKLLNPNSTGIAANLREWVQSVGEREAGVASVSAPVCAADGRVLAAVSVSGPIERTTRQPGKRYGEQVELAARRIERAAGLTT